MLPFTSVVATVAGLVMMFGQTSIRALGRFIRPRIVGLVGPRKAPKPHFRVGADSRSHVDRHRS
jgi:hypothetical protein